MCWRHTTRSINVYRYMRFIFIYIICTSMSLLHIEPPTSFHTTVLSTAPPLSSLLRLLGHIHPLILFFSSPRLLRTSTTATPNTQLEWARVRERMRHISFIYWLFLSMLYMYKIGIRRFSSVIVYSNQNFCLSVTVVDSQYFHIAVITRQYHRQFNFIAIIYPHQNVMKRLPTTTEIVSIKWIYSMFSMGNLMQRVDGHKVQ